MVSRPWAISVATTASAAVIVVAGGLRSSPRGVPIALARWGATLRGPRLDSRLRGNERSFADLVGRLVMLDLYWVALCRSARFCRAARLIGGYRPLHAQSLTNQRTPCACAPPFHP